MKETQAIPAPVDQDLCGARTRGGGLCKRYPTQGRNRCRLHGGKTPQGINHPSYKHGRYATAVRDGMTKRSQDLAEDPRLLDPRRVIASSTEALEKLEEMSETDDGPDFRREALRLFRAMEGAEKGPEKAHAKEMVVRHLEEGVQGANALVGICTVGEQITRMIERYWRLASGALRGISLDEVLEIMQGVQRILTEEQDAEFAARVMARADAETTGGAFGFGSERTVDVPPA